MPLSEDTFGDPRDMGEEEIFFSLTLMKYVYRICNVPLPLLIKHKLEELDLGLSVLFTENMKDAMCTSVSELYRHNYQSPIIGSIEYNVDVLEIQEFYTHEDFFEFASFYAPQAAFERLGVTGDRFCGDIAGILKDNAPIRYSWIEFDKIAQEIAQRNGILTKFKNSHSEADMIKEREFLLRCLNYVCLLHFASLPEYLGRQVNKLDHSQENNPLTNNIAHAIAILLNNQIQVRLLLGKGGIEKHYHRSVLKKFEPRNFLEFCVCHSRKALFDYYNCAEFDSPVKIYEIMVSVVKHAKECEEFPSWDEIEKAALQLIEDDVYRTENENRRLKFINQYKSQRIVTVDLTNSAEKPLKIFRNNSQEFGNPFFQCSNERHEKECKPISFSDEDSVNNNYEQMKITPSSSVEASVIERTVEQSLEENKVEKDKNVTISEQKF